MSLAAGSEGAGAGVVVFKCRCWSSRHGDAPDTPLTVGHMAGHGNRHVQGLLLLSQAC